MSNSYKVKCSRRRNRKKLMYAFGEKCCICGYGKCDRALCFHHLNPEEKSFSIGTLFKNNYSWETIVKEAKKCVLVCSNCHAEIHDGITEIPDNVVKFDINLIEENDFFDFCPHCGSKKRKHRQFCSRQCAGSYNAENPNKIVWDEIDLIELYKKHGSLNSISRELNIPSKRLSKQFKKLGYDQDQLLKLKPKTKPKSKSKNKLDDKKIKHDYNKKVFKKIPNIDWDEHDILAMKQNGLSNVKIARIYNCSEMAVRKHLKKLMA